MTRPTETPPRCSWLRDTPRPSGVPPWLVCVRKRCLCREPSQQTGDRRHDQADV
jgi:hypothetical protein